MNSYSNDPNDQTPKDPTDVNDVLSEIAGEHPAVKDSGLVLPDQILPPNLFVLPVNSSIVYPSLMAPLVVNHPKFVGAVEEVLQRNRVIGLLLTRDDELREDVTPDRLYSVGVVVKILKRLKMPDGSVNLLIHSMKRFRVRKVLADHPNLVIEPEYLEDIVEKSTEMDALTRAVVSHVKKLSETNPFFTDEMRLAMINAPSAGTVADLIAFALSLNKDDAQAFLETVPVRNRFEMLLTHLRREQDVADVQKKIHDDVNTKLTKMQREFFLKEQLKAIKKELGGEEDGQDRTVRTFRERIEAAGMPEDVKKVALEEVEKFEAISESSPEYNIVRNYLETLCSLPWSVETVDSLDLGKSRKILEDDHYGLEKVKDRILEFLAVRKLMTQAKVPPKGSIICLVGPPGVGKTSVGKSIAKALDRNFYRFSLGGMRDEAEIKGHRRTYIGAMPGKMITAMRRAGSKNAVIMLDEIDKLGASFQGDPASALLEVLDPEQNHAFIDHYLDVPFDLSKVLFVATANTLSTIPAPLLDRMEVIEIPGYTLEEKEEIAVRYVWPKALSEHGLRGSQVKIEKPAIRRIMLDYAREPGLRILQQLFSRIARKAATKLVEHDEKRPKNGAKITPIFVREADLVDWLGPKRYYNELAERITAPGVVVGLAWTATGGDILFIEAMELPGSGGLKLTGQMGEVMTESAAIAWSYVKKKAGKDLKFDQTYFKHRDFHLHIPAGAIPKDGPSAGVTMATALYSLLSGRKFRQKLAMTGELSLIGKVLPIGGVKEKILAAKRAGITELILPKLNEKDVREVPEYALRGMTIHYVSHVEEVFALALEDATAKKRPAKGKVIRAKVARAKVSTAKRPKTTTRSTSKSL
ncbi:MAG: endopeptidase La [Bdellovibrionales bacterium]|nr:endopeptidase La [Bdellovibrionales bacterium]